MYLKRRIDAYLLAWKRRKDRLPLIIKGARQIGKTESILHFAKQQYKNIVSINFVLEPKYKTILSDGYEVADIIKNISLIDPGKRFIPGDTLLIFDELQEFPDIATALKAFKLDGRFDVICSGSLLGINYRKIHSNSVGYKTDYEMFSMDFEEFLWAMDNEMLMPVIRDCFEKKKPMGQMLHRKAVDYFRQYMIVGGMPQAVEKYIQTRDFEAVDIIKRNILNLYREDIMKHSDGNELEIEAIFDEIPAQLSKHEKKFKLSDIKPSARMREYKQPFYWLDDAMIVNNCYNSTEPNIGLKMNMERKTLKCYMADTGLLISHAFDENGIVSEEIYKKLLFDKLSVNSGMLMENIAAQMLTASEHKLYFFSKSSRENSQDRMEIDFLIAKSKVTNKHNISPIEVKSGDRYALSSIKKFINKYKEQTNIPYVLHTKDLKKENGITYLPLYMTMLL